MDQEAMLKACRHAFWMGYMGTVVIDPGWINAVNEGFKPPNSDLDLAYRVKIALDEAYAKGEGSVKVDGRMYDVANMKYVNYILERVRPAPGARRRRPPPSRLQEGSIRAHP